MIIGLITDLAYYRKLPTGSRSVQNLIEALEGYAVTSTALHAHAIEHSRSHLTMRGNRDAVNAMVLTGLRNRFQLKDLQCRRIRWIRLQFVSTIS